MFWYPFIMIVSQFSTRVALFAGMADKKPELKPGLFTCSLEQVDDSRTLRCQTVWTVTDSARHWFQ